ncbi:MAG: ABC transporter ATP-binding protein [Planctomycetes bacterium]|nr:ABC transporter ATP-binding protein [Planctomycetota bacterium]
MSLHLDFELRRGALDLRIALEVSAGRSLALVGPNGAGKSTCLHAVAGLLRIDAGRIALGAETLDGGPRGSFALPEQRGIGFVPQSALLFPHLDVLHNVAYGARARGHSRAEARGAAREALQRVGLASLAARRPRQLSGGEAQRVALARALASAPRVLLLDEPLSAVDASARVALRQDLARHLASFEGPRIVVTHDAVDAFVLGERIAVLEDGRVVQQGSAAEIVAAPRSRYVADLVGQNFLQGTVEDSVLTLASGAQLRVASAVQGRAVATISPRALSLFPRRPEGSPRNVWEAPLEALEHAPSGIRVRLGGAIPIVAEITPASVAELHLEVGSRIWVALKATEIQVAPL